MAVSKIWNVNSRLDKVINYGSNKKKTINPDYNPLKTVLDYGDNPDKTEKQLYSTGINCDAEFAYQQFMTVKMQYGKTDGILGYHGYMSFKPGEVTPEVAHKIGIEAAKRIWGKRFQVVVDTHLNTDCLHNHFIINSVSFVDGKRCRETSWFKNKMVFDEVCKEYGISVIDKPNRTIDRSYINQKEQAGMPTRYNLAKEALDVAIENSKSIKELEYNLKKLGYSCNFNVNHMAKMVFEEVWKNRTDCISETIKIIKRCYRENKVENNPKNSIMFQIEKIKSKKNILLDMRTSGEITKDEFLEQKEVLNKKLSLLESELQNCIEIDTKQIQIDYDEILKSLNEIVNFSNSKMDRELLQRFIAKVVPNGENHFIWYLNLDGKSDTQLNVDIVGNKKNALVSIDESGDTSPLHISDILYFNDKKSFTVETLHRLLSRLRKRKLALVLKPNK